MMAALTAAKEGAQVTILEGGERVGKKILATGNGKCNLGNLQLSSEDYYGSSGEWITECLDKFGTKDSLQFWKELGMQIKDKNGYLYPLSEQASTVLDVLRIQLKICKVEVITECKVTQIHPGVPTAGFEVVASGEKYFFDRLIMACGGKAAPKTGSDGSGYRLAEKLGHHIIPVVPALVQLTCRENYWKAISGVRVDGEVKVYSRGKCIASERGEIQLTDYGISGIPVFQLSRKVNYLLREQQEVKVILDLLPDYDVVFYEKLQLEREKLKKGRTVEEFFTGLLHKKLLTLFVKMAGLKQAEPAEYAGKQAIEEVYARCKEWEIYVNGSKSFDSAQVCAGGVDTSQVCTDMQSKLIPNLYFAGEILDVDGRCGGYNLHWAWCSGYLAGKSAASRKG